MGLLSRRMRPDVRMRAGLVILAVAGIAKWSLERSTALSDAWTGAVVGLLYGMAIPLLLCGLWAKRRRLGPE